MEKTVNFQLGAPVIAGNLATYEKQETPEQQAINNAVKTLLMAAKANAWSNNIAARALNGLAGYVCGNNDIYPALAVLRKLPEKYVKKYAALLEIALGHFHKAEEKDGKITIYQALDPLFSVTKKGIFCTMEELTQGTKRERLAAVAKLCANRFKLPKDLTTIKVKPYPREKDIASDTLALVNKALASAARQWGNWQNSPDATKLRRLLELIGQEAILSSKDNAVTAQTAGIGGRPKIK